MDNPHMLLTTEEAAEILRTPARTLEHWRTSRKGPRFARFGRTVFYRRDDIEAFINERFAAWDDWQES